MFYSQEVIEDTELEEDGEADGGRGRGLGVADMTLAEITAFLDCAGAGLDLTQNTSTSIPNEAFFTPSTSTSRHPDQEIDATSYRTPLANILSSDDEDSPLPLRQRILASENKLNTPSTFDRCRRRPFSVLPVNSPRDSPHTPKLSDRSLSPEANVISDNSPSPVCVSSPPARQILPIHLRYDVQDSPKTPEEDRAFGKTKKPTSLLPDVITSSFLPTKPTPTDLSVGSISKRQPVPTPSRPARYLSSDDDEEALENSSRKKRPDCRNTCGSVRKSEVKDETIDLDELQQLAVKSSDSDEAREMEKMFGKPAPRTPFEAPIKETAPAKLPGTERTKSSTKDAEKKTGKAFRFWKHEKVAERDYFEFVSTFHLCEKSDFSRRRQSLTSILFSVYNATVFDGRFSPNFNVTWNKRLTRTAGLTRCKATRNKAKPDVVLSRDAEIELSTKVVDSSERLRDTLIHEMCHAAVWLFNGDKSGHGYLWKMWAQKANLTHTCLPVISRCHSYEIAFKYTYQCSRCSNTVGRHSKSLDTEKFVCAMCCGTFKLMPSANSRTPGRNLPDKENQRARCDSPLNPFAKYVQDNYRSVKESCSSHKDTMSELSKMYKSMKMCDI